jgi:transposase-like protein
MEVAALPRWPGTLGWRGACFSGGGSSSRFPGVDAPKANADTNDVRALRQQLRDVTEERDVLKKALAYFADDQK